MAMDIREIEAVLPHRYPFLMVDRVDSIDDTKIVARKMVTRNEPHFQGHFPGHPVMPGVLIVEALAQVGAIFAAHHGSFDSSKQVVYFLSMDGVKFRKPVVPGDLLELVVTPLRRGGVVWKMRGEAKVDGVVVTEAEFVASIQPRPAGNAPAAGAASAG